MTDLQELWDTKVHETKVIGHVGVDSGTIMIIDPCYVLPDDRGGTLGPGEPDFPDPSVCDDNNSFINKDNTSVYLHAVGQLYQADAPGEEDKSFATWHDGVITSTLYGDGGYPVTAELNKHGKVLRVTVDFT